MLVCRQQDFAVHASCDEQPSLHNLPPRPHVIQDFLKQSHVGRATRKAWYQTPRSRPLCRHGTLRA
jgi:hypothetical protein